MAYLDEQVDDAQAGLAEVDACLSDLRKQLDRANGPEAQGIRTTLAGLLVERYGIRGEPGSGEALADLSEAIYYAELALTPRPDDASEASQAMFVAGLAYYLRSGQREDPADLDSAVRHLTALRQLAETHPARDDDDRDLHRDALAILAEVLAIRSRMTADGDAIRDADRSEAIRIQARRCRELDDEGTPDAALLLELGRLYEERYQRRAPGDSGAGDLDAALTCLRRVSGDPAADPAVVAEADLYRGEVLARRVLSMTASAAEVDEAITALTRARPALDAGDIAGAITALHEGIARGARYLMHRGTPGDRQSGLAALRDALRHQGLRAEPALADVARIWLGQLLMTPLPPEQLPGGGTALNFSRELTDRLGELLATDAVQAGAAEAVEELSQVSDQTLRDPEAAAAVAALLGSALLARGTSGTPASDLDRIAGHLAEVTRLTPPGTANSAEFAALYAWILAERANRPGDGEAIDQAIPALTRALGQLEDREHAFRPVVLHHLGLLLGRRGLLRSAPADLTAGIDALTEALALMGNDHPMRSETLGTLGAALMSGAQFDVSALRLDATIDLLAEVRDHPHPDAARQAVQLCCYGQALHVRAIRDHAHRGFAEAIATVREAEQVLPAGHPVQAFLLLTLASMLADQYDYVGNLETLDAAAFYLDEVEAILTAASAPAFNPEGVDLYSVRAMRGHVRMRQGHRREDRMLLDTAIADLEFALGVVPTNHPMRPRIASDLNVARLGRAALTEDMAGLTAAVSALTQTAQDLPEGHVDRAPLAGRTGLILLGQAVTRRDLSLLDQGIAQLRAAARHPGLMVTERARLSWGVGLGLVTRYDVARDPADLDAAVRELEEAHRDLAAGPGNPVAAHVLAELAGAYRKRADRARGDQRRAIETGIEALREQAGDVLLQTGTERGLTMARMAAADAAEISSWCRADGVPDRAVETLELSRGLVLHAATSAAQLPELLRAAGHADLATEWAALNEADPEGPARGGRDVPWERARGQGGDQPLIRADLLMADLRAMSIPDDLRHRVLLALADSGLDRALLTPPDPARIAALMRATGTDIVAYLVAAGEHDGGHAVVIRPDGSVDDLSLPWLDVSPGSPAYVCATAQREALSAEMTGPGTPAAAQARDRWIKALGRLAGWAWPAAVRRLLAAAPPADPARPPRVLLIPFGLLGVVPWHAASYRDSSGTTRYACQQAVFSYAASARQLADATARKLLPPEAGQVLVADPVEGNVWATWEAEALQAAYYPGATLLGRREPRATPASVLAALPGGPVPSGAALLHLACHARTAPSPADSHLRLRADEKALVERPLPVDQILRQAARKPPGAPGGLVVLAACVSDMSTSDYDEALTLASAFMTAGAVTVVGTRWHVPDVRTAILMFMFHHYLNASSSPAGALRRAQAWMLDVGREVPAGMPPMLAEEIPRRDLTELVAWAGFVHQGK